MNASTFLTGPSGALAAWVAGGLFVLIHLVRAWQRHAKARAWSAVARRRCAMRDAAAQRPLPCGPAPPPREERRVYQMPAHAIADGVALGQLSASLVMAVFIRRARRFGHALNCVTEEIYAEAWAQAQALDAARAAPTPTPTPTNPCGRRRTPKQQHAASPSPRVLEGVPISLKENFEYAGTDATCGLAARCFKPSAEDGLLVQLLKDAGAIPFVKTNVPQALLAFESTNRVYGKSLNAWDPLRTPGGSTGGEGGLLAARASPLAVGTDIGGSIRMPCNFSGLYGFKPTTTRVSKKGMTAPRLNNENGQTLISAVAGPLGTNVRDLSLVLRAWWDTDRMFEADPYVIPKRFDHATFASGRGPGAACRIGLITTDRHFEVCGAVRRALDVAADGLRAQGHDVVATELPRDGWDIIRLYYRVMGADGGLHFMREALEGEGLAEMYREMNVAANLPDWLRALACFVLQSMGREHRLTNLIGHARQKGVDARTLFRVNIELQRFQQAYVRFMRDEKLDALLLPVSALPATTHGKSTRMMYAAAYSFLPNILHWPAGVCPVTRVRADEQTYDISALPKRQQDSLAAIAAEQIKGTAGLPVGVQLMTPPLQDELCLFLMAELERAVPFSEMPATFDVPVGSR